jgi:hypothetical protein
MQGVIQDEHGRSERRLRLLRDLQHHFPDVTQVKGEVVSRHYPPAVVRQTHDLDLHISTVAGLWSVAVWLQAHNFKASALTLREADGALHALLSLEREGGPFAWPDRVELSTLSLQGNLVDVRPTAKIGGVSNDVESALILLEERFERRFIARDVVDGIVLLRSLGPDGTRDLINAAAAVDLLPELSELVRAIEAVGLGSPVQVPAEAIARVVRRRATRRSKAIRGRRGLVLLGQERLLSGRLNGLRGKLWEALIRRLGASELLSLGLLLFAAPVEGHAASEFSTRMSPTRPFAYAATPLGPYVLTPFTRPDPDFIQAELARLGD